jgi:hypothetical protein
MRWSKCLPLLLITAVAQADGGAYLLGAGVEADDADGFRVSVLTSVEVGENTWLSGALSSSTVDLGSGDGSDTMYGDFEIDHFFDPIGISVGAAYWGDPDLLDSVDLRGALYTRSERLFLALEYEHRDFDFIIPPFLLFPGREVAFTANGIGARLRYRFSDSFSLALSGKQYDYSVDFRPNENRDAIRLISASRLGLINSLIDSRVGVDFLFDVGARRWQFSYVTWDGALDRSSTDSVTVSYLHPASARSDLEFSIGYDDSDLYGDVTFASVYWYFYGN